MDRLDRCCICHARPDRGVGLTRIALIRDRATVPYPGGLLLDEPVVPAAIEHACYRCWLVERAGRLGAYALVR